MALAIFYAASAQDCSNYYFFQQNKTIEMTIYNKKGSETGKQVYKVSDVKNNGGNVSATIQTELFDKKGKSTATSTGEYKCTGGVVMVNMKMVVPQQSMEQFKNAEVKADDIYLEYPSNMKVGDQLKDGNFSMEITNGGLKQNFNMIMSDRKVEGRESVTSPAGTWECYKISYKAKMTIKTAGIGIPVSFDGIEYFAPGFGVVKTESKHGSTLITSIE